MFWWWNSQFSGFLCFSFSLVLAVLLILWKGRRAGCPSCRHANPTHANYCGHCGTRLR